MSLHRPSSGLGGCTDDHVGVAEGLLQFGCESGSAVTILDELFHDGYGYSIIISSSIEVEPNERQKGEIGQGLRIRKFLNEPDSIIL